MLYADIIVDISHENLDRTYQYAVPEEMISSAVVGTPVEIPFGNGGRIIRGYIIGLSDEPKINPEKIKYIKKAEQNGIVIESRMIALASKMRELYGGTMNDALRTVTPVKRTIRAVNQKTIRRNISKEEIEKLLDIAVKKHHTARERLLRELLKEKELDYELVIHKLNINRKTILEFASEGIVSVEESRAYRNPGSTELFKTDGKEEGNPWKNITKLNEEQQSAADEVMKDYRDGRYGTYLLYGVTGSGKTEVYLELIRQVVEAGRQVIMLIPEIALTYQTMIRFRQRFGNRVSFMHSRLSDGERYDQYVRAAEGDIDIMIGPRSALFTPFRDPGLIIIDEEHEASYKSEQVPKYHARELAVEYAAMLGASVLLGSATPSLESYYRAERGEYRLLRLTRRAGKAELPAVHIVDMREELKAHNVSVFSRQLRALMEDRLKKKQQIMIFINRRGFAGFVSCRSCGEALRCPHCEVSLTAHNNGRLICHYCGFERQMPKNCPSCGSKYIALFGTGTQKVETIIQREFPGARVLRMDADTTRQKEGHEQILSAFANEEADILVGTQMIVKGHDFERVTLMGIIAADLSLQTADYRAGERTFQLLTQAAGRSGRAKDAGEVVIQTYQPEHYSITAAASEDYLTFYHSEMMYRKALGYPPVSCLASILLGAENEKIVTESADVLADGIRAWMEEYDLTETGTIIGPAPAGISKLRDIYRKVIYIKHSDAGILTRCRDAMEQTVKDNPAFSECTVQFDFNPLTSY